MYACVFAEVFNGLVEVVIYPLVLRIFYKYRKTMVQSQDAPELLQHLEAMETKSHHSRKPVLEPIHSVEPLEKTKQENKQDVHFEAINLHVLNHQTFESYIGSVATDVVQDGSDL